jgi:hypothetical protein
MVFFFYGCPPKNFQNRKPKPARIPPQTPPPRGRDRIPHPATISPDNRGGVRSGLLLEKGSRKGYNFTAFASLKLGFGGRSPQEQKRVSLSYGVISPLVSPERRFLKI